MLLPFKETFHWGDPTHFIIKMWISTRVEELFTAEQHKEYLHAYKEKFGKPWSCDESLLHPKNHSIRLDPNGLWTKPGRIIHPVVNNRTRDIFQFMPAMPVASTQRIEMKYQSKQLVIKIDGSKLPIVKWDDLALNDGFEPSILFLKWFDKDFQGTIIHWTKLRY